MGTALKGGVLLPVLLTAALSVGCARDPEVAKREYVQSGDRFRAARRRSRKPSFSTATRSSRIRGSARRASSWPRPTSRTATGGEAAARYIRAADLLPKDVEAQLKAGRVLLFARQFQDAATRAHNALALDRHNVDAQMLLGNALAGLRDVDGAIEEIQEAIRARSEQHARVRQPRRARARRRPAGGRGSGVQEGDRRRPEVDRGVPRAGELLLGQRSSRRTRRTS